MRFWVQTLALLSGLRIQRGCELWCSSQMRLRSQVAVAVVWASSYSSNQTPSLGTSICHGAALEKDKRQKTKDKKKRKETMGSPVSSSCCEHGCVSMRMADRGQTSNCHKATSQHPRGKQSGNPGSALTPEDMSQSTRPTLCKTMNCVWGPCLQIAHGNDTFTHYSQ